MTEDVRELASWSDFGDAVSRLTKSVNSSEFRPDCIIAIARGGLIVGGALAHALGIKDVYTMNIEYYTGNGLNDVQLPEPKQLEPALDPAILKGRNVLIADDVADSGITLDFVTKLLGPETNAKTAVWYNKPRSVFTPDFSASTTAEWIVFPWSPFSPFGEAAQV